MTESRLDGIDVGSSDALPPKPILLGALEGTEDGLLVTDLEGSPRYYNQRFLDLLRIPSDVFEDTSFEEALEGSLSLFSRPERFKQVAQCNRENPSSVTEHEFQLRDGTVIQRFSRPLRLADRLAGRVSTLRDVTDLRENERRLQEAQRLTHVGSWEWDIETDSIHWSDEMYRIFGQEPESFEATLEAFMTYVHPEDREMVREAVETSLRDREEYSAAFRIVRAGDELRHLHAAGEVLTDDQGEPVLIRGALQDVTDRVESRRARDRAERRYRTLFDMSPLALGVSRPGGEMVAANDRFEALLGHSTDEVQGRHVQELNLWVDYQDRRDLLQRVEEEGVIQDYETQLQSADGELIEVELSVDQVRLDGETYLAWAIRDVTERNQYREELEQKALYDQLTGLPNRALLFDRLEHAIQRADREGEPLTVLFLDLDGFKAVNSAYGHTVGDRVLAETAARLQPALREVDTLGRIGGDEFLAILQGTDPEGAQKVCRRLLDSLDKARYEVPDGTVTLGASIGIAPLTEDRREPAELIRAADAAMQEAKATGQDRYRFRVYSSEDEVHLTQLHRRRRLRRAIEEDEFMLHYQPVIDLRANRVAGAEALVRWEHPEQGLLSPGAFIPLAEQEGMIEEVDEWVLRRAASQGAELTELMPGDRGERPFHVAVNVSAPFYQSPDFSEEVWEALETGVFAPERLQLEITERISVSRIGGWSRLRDAGVTLAIDDFGTGYSSLRYLQQLEADALKIDRYFVSELGAEGSRTSLLVTSVLTLGRQMGMDVIAEGVETQEQADHLREIGCPYAQGYHFGRPMPEDKFRHLLKGEGDGGTDGQTDGTEG